MSPERKKQQHRMTYDDTKFTIFDLYDFFLNKIQLNEGIKSKEELRYFMNMFSDAVMSHGSYQFSFRILGWGIIPYGNFGKFVISFALRSVGVEGTFFYLVDKASGEHFKVEFKDIWDEILEKVMYIQTYALEEAKHMSREAQIREEVSGHRISLEDKVNKK